MSCNKCLANNKDLLDMKMFNIPMFVVVVLLLKSLIRSCFLLTKMLLQVALCLQKVVQSNGILFIITCDSRWLCLCIKTASAGFYWEHFNNCLRVNCVIVGYTSWSILGMIDAGHWLAKSNHFTVICDAPNVPHGQNMATWL